jgi:elongation factor 1-alpha
VPFIPVSALCGENLTEKSDKFLWYEGPTLLQALQSINPLKRLTEKPLRFCVQHAIRISGTGTVLLGKVETGILRSGMDIVINPN